MAAKASTGEERDDALAPPCDRAGKFAGAGTIVVIGTLLVLSVAALGPLTEQFGPVLFSR